MTVQILTGDCREHLKMLPDKSVHCCVTSPPYFGLRDYGVGGQMGMETTPDAFVTALVEVFRDVRRVLRDDGTLWLNLGDSYANDDKWGGHTGGKHVKVLHCSPIGRNKRYTGLKPKDLIGIPWRVAFALQADGWWLRQDIIWSKPNPMPESVTDRCTKAHEYLFMLSKSARYFYDQEAIKEPATGTSEHDLTGPAYQAPGQTRQTGTRVKPDKQRGHGRRHVGFNDRWDAMSRAEQCSGTRNKRSVWTIATAPFKEAHFATFPPALIEPCIRAGTSEKGCCAVCGAPWVRETKTTYTNPGNRTTNGPRSIENREFTAGFAQRLEKQTETTGWLPGCECEAAIMPCTVLDPFGGAGTTGLVADRLQRNAILIELSPSYAAMARKRIDGDAPLFNEGGSRNEEEADGAPRDGAASGLFV